MQNIEQSCKKRSIIDNISLNTNKKMKKNTDHELYENAIEQIKNNSDIKIGMKLMSKIADNNYLPAMYYMIKTTEYSINIDNRSSFIFENCIKECGISELSNDSKIILDHDENYSTEIKNNNNNKTAYISWCRTMAISMLKSNLCKHQLDIALHYLKLAADDGDSISQYRLGMVLVCGIFNNDNVNYLVKPDQSLAVKYLYLASIQNNYKALLILGLCTIDGIGCNKNIFHGVDYIKLSADNGNIAAKYHLIDCIAKGVGFSCDLEYAHKLMSELVIKNTLFDETMYKNYNLSFSISLGRGYPKDIQYAYKLIAQIALDIIPISVEPFNIIGCSN